jgi:hypothetical protein
MTEVSFSVDPEGMDTLRGRLAAIESRMQGIGDTVSSYAWQDLGPDPGVYNTLGSFHSDWSNGLAMISHNIQALTKLLANAAGDYRGTDNQIAQAAVPQDGAA